VTDVTGDGFADIVILAVDGEGTVVRLLEGGGSPATEAPTILRLDHRLQDLQLGAGHVTGNRHGDVVIHARNGDGTGELRIFRGARDGFLPGERIPFRASKLMDEVKMTLTDATGDGLDDILLLRRSEAAPATQVDVYLLEGDRNPSSKLVRVDTLSVSLDELSPG